MNTKNRIRPIGLGEVRRVAGYDPRLAFAIAKSFSTGLGLTGWEIFNITGQFTTQTAGQAVQAQLGRQVEADLLVRKIMYTVQRPNANPGNPWKGQWDYYNRLSPNINFTFLVDGLCRYVIASDPTPLENIETVFEAVAPAGMALTATSTIEVDFTTLRALGDGENPTNAVISLHAQRLPYGVYSSCNETAAIKWLVQNGYLDDSGECIGCGGDDNPDDSGE